MQYCPTEVLTEILLFLKPKDLMKCREVCSRWNEIINDLSKSNIYWQKHCQNDFTDVCKVAFKKRKKGLSWKNLYRSLYLWSKLHIATEIHSEITTSSSNINEIYGFQLLKDNRIGVHARSGIVYFDVTTLRQFHQDSISGEYLHYAENDNAIIVLATTWDIYIVRKIISSPSHEQQASFSCVKHFIINNDDVYYVTLDDDIYVCNTLTEKLVSRLVKQMATRVISLGFKDGLNVLTIDRKIYTIINNKYVFRQKLSDSHNIINTLKQYNFIENLDWQAHFHWLFKEIVPTDFSRDISIIKVYGNMVFVGSNYGGFSMYNSTYFNSQFDLFNTKPVKHYNFMDCNDQLLTNCPIVQIDVLEGEDSHKVLVGMPKKIMVLQFYHE